MTLLSIRRPNSTFVTTTRRPSPANSTFHIPKMTIEAMLSRWNPVSATIRDAEPDGSVTGTVTGWPSIRRPLLLSHLQKKKGSLGDEEEGGGGKSMLDR
jgi:hypothetical protein